MTRDRIQASDSSNAGGVDHMVQTTETAGQTWHKEGIMIDKDAMPTTRQEIAETVFPAEVPEDCETPYCDTSYWGIIKSPVQTSGEPSVLSDDSVICLPEIVVPKLYVLQRTDTGDVVGECGERYDPLQPIEMCALAEPWTMSGKAHLETAGVLHGGRKAWLQMRLDGLEADIVPGDAIKRFVSVCSGFDGLTATSLDDGEDRICCQNTLQHAVDKMAVGRSVRHTRDQRIKLANISEELLRQAQIFEEVCETYKAMARHAMSSASEIEYLYNVFSVPSDRRDIGKAPKAVLECLALGASGLGADIPGVQGSLWGSLNSVTEYVGYRNGRTSERRADLERFGSGKAISLRAYDCAFELVDA
jgi:phage/plasmid-like protein (TIGR03299 family)